MPELSGSLSGDQSVNEHDLNHVGSLLHVKDECVFAVAGYLEAANRVELADVNAKWAMAMRPGKLRN